MSRNPRSSPAKSYRLSMLSDQLLSGRILQVVGGTMGQWDARGHTQGISMCRSSENLRKKWLIIGIYWDYVWFIIGIWIFGFSGLHAHNQ